jgi:hypothetical protein
MKSVTVAWPVVRTNYAMVMLCSVRKVQVAERVVSVSSVGPPERKYS